MQGRWNICPRCNSELPEDSAFCPKCGNMIPGARLLQGQFCTMCGTRNDSGAKFCVKCGRPLGSREEDIEFDDSEPENRSRFWVIVIIVVLLIALAAGGSAAAIWWDARRDEQELEKEKESSEGTVIDNDDEELPVEEDSDSEGDADAEADDTEADDTEETQTPEVYDVTEGGIHRYEYVISDCTWEEAYAECKSRGGYLVRINSPEEFEYIRSQIEEIGYNKTQFYIGGRRTQDSKEYYWIAEDGRPYGNKINDVSYWCQNAWMKNEPSFQDGSIQEDCLNIFYYSKESRWVFNDVPNDILSVVPDFSGKIGYVCEYE